MRLLFRLRRPRCCRWLPRANTWEPSASNTQDLRMARLLPPVVAARRALAPAASTPKRAPLARWFPGGATTSTGLPSLMPLRWRTRTFQSTTASKRSSCPCSPRLSPLTSSPLPAPRFPRLLSCAPGTMATSGRPLRLVGRWIFARRRGPGFPRRLTRGPHIIISPRASRKCARGLRSSSASSPTLARDLALARLGPDRPRKLSGQPSLCRPPPRRCRELRRTRC